MGELIDGVWHPGAVGAAGAGGRFERRDSVWRNWITPDGAPGPTGEGGFPAAAGRYHLYVSLACPWAHRVLIARALKGLATLIGVSVVHPDMLDDGWTFDTGFPGTTGDPLHGARFLRDIYLRADPRATTRVTVPVLWDRARGTIVSNESADILRMFDTAFAGLTGIAPDLRPRALVPAIDAANERIYAGLTNGVYRAGFAATQAAYDEAAAAVFATLDWLEAVLARQPFVAGDVPTEADWRLFPTLVRFDTVYHGHFKCNRARIVDYPALWAYTRALWQAPGVAATVRLDHAARHYYHSHRMLNPRGIVPVGPRPDFAAPHGRAVPWG